MSPSKAYIQEISPEESKPVHDLRPSLDRIIDRMTKIRTTQPNLSDLHRTATATGAAPRPRPSAPRDGTEAVRRRRPAPCPAVAPWTTRLPVIDQSSVDHVFRTSPNAVKRCEDQRKHHPKALGSRAKRAVPAEPLLAFSSGHPTSIISSHRNGPRC